VICHRLPPAATTGLHKGSVLGCQHWRPGGHVGFVGVAHGVALPAMDLFWSLARLHGGPAPVRRFLPQLVDLIWNRQIEPGRVFDLELPLADAAAGYEAMDERRAIKALLRPQGPGKVPGCLVWAAVPGSLE
jgi:threonine dehydrogenase-like Zn-dependent dehydrogenase